MSTASSVVLLALCAWLSGCNAYDTALLPRLTAPDTDSGMPHAHMPNCGNGQRDEGELCDTLIPEGEQGACPTDCPTEDACNPMVSAGMDCQLQCVGLEITKAINDDGCCPKGVGPDEDSDCGHCGDRVTGPKETCEPPDKCPTRETCVSVNACLIKIFSGTPETCSSECELRLIESCKNGDGCCPPACNTATDSDCSPSCGNGIFEEEVGETCEANSERPCATTCDDGVGCTKDVPTGSAENCSFTCAHVDITSPVSGDSCCPSGANANNDTDCVPFCGNGSAEPGELCDPCSSNCADQDPCTTDSSTGTDCNVSCTHTQVTQPLHGDSCCPSGAHANNDSDCAPQCGNGIKEGSEACDGGPLCRNCAWLFHSSLVHRYSFNGTGTTITDSIGTAHGTAMSCTLNDTGAIELAGGSSNDYVQLPSDLLNGLTQVTFEAWVRWDGGARKQRIFDFGESGGYTFVMAEPANGDDGYLGAYMSFTSGVVDAAQDWKALDGAGLSTSGVHHVAVTFSGTRLTLYLDGAEQASQTKTSQALSAINDSRNWLGRSQFSADPYFDGAIHEFRIYTKSLTPSEITSSYNAGQNP